jgi:hypothetical protein
MSNNRINISQIAKEIFKDKELFIEELSNDKIKIFYKNERVYRSIGGSDPRPFVLPKLIKLNEEFAEAIGLYLGDGKTTKNDMQHLEFSNKDYDIINFMLTFFKSNFLVGLNNMTITIKYKNGNKERNVEKWSKFLNMSQREIAVIINSYQGNVCRTAKGEHLLRVNQIENLLPHTKLSVGDFVANTKSVRIGNGKNKITDRDLVRTVFNFQLY